MLRIGIVGCGNVGAGLHLSAWQANRQFAEVVGLADPTEVSLESARVAAGLAQSDVHFDPADLIARDDVDALDICTPQHLRRELLVDAARAGKHILCEKPIASIPADAMAGVAAAAEYGVVLAMLHNYLWLPEIQEALNIVASGEIGEVRAVIVNFLGVVDVPGNAAYQSDWRKDPALSGGGVLIDMLHGVYLAEALLGERIERVSAYVGSRDSKAGVEDIALCRYETVSNVGLVNIGWGLGPGGIEVSGTGGRVSVRYKNGGTAPWAPLEHVLVTTSAGTRVALGPEGREPTADGISRSIYDSFEYAVADFAQAVLSGQKPTASGDDGMHILEATLAAYESGVVGAVVNLPLDQDDPMIEEGVLGLRRLPFPDWSPLHRQSLFGVSPVS